ncbi:MAG TPA: glutathione peroxidase, partial [Alphaproteobacteria bacterium]|nr:glutathione peroxidase [Alphaproteobacteria bacterium]
MGNLHEFTVKDIDGRDRDLGELSGKAVLVVNVASKCGLTPQYDGLQRLYGEYRGRGLEILGFPCNQFMGQEPGTESEIKEFCTLHY